MNLSIFKVLQHAIPILLLLLLALTLLDGDAVSATADDDNYSLIDIDDIWQHYYCQHMYISTVGNIICADVYGVAAAQSTAVIMLPLLDSVKKLLKWLMWLNGCCTLLTCYGKLTHKKRKTKKIKRDEKITEINHYQQHE